MKKSIIATFASLSLALTACTTATLKDARQDTSGLEQAKVMTQENLSTATAEANIVNSAEKATLQSAKADKKAEKAQRKADKAKKKAEKRAKKADKRAKRAEAKAKKAQAKIQKAEELLQTQ